MQCKIDISNRFKTALIYWGYDMLFYHNDAINFLKIHKKWMFKLPAIFQFVDVNIW